MSIRWIAHVWETSPYEGRRLLLHLALADFANDEGTCFPSQKTLAEKARTTETWASASIRQMVRDGLLVILEQGSGRGNRTLYRLRKAQTQFGESQIGETEEGESPNNELSRTTYRNRKEPSLELTNAFDEFWKIYPRKVAKTAARNVFSSIMRRSDAPSIGEVLDGVRRYAALRLEPRFIAHPTTWLRQGRWEDDLGSETSASPTARDEVLDHALNIFVPLVHLGRTLEECLDALGDVEPRIVERCRAVYSEIRR